MFTPINSRGGPGVASRAALAEKIRGGNGRRAAKAKVGPPEFFEGEICKAIEGQLVRMGTLIAMVYVDRVLLEDLKAGQLLGGGSVGLAMAVKPVLEELMELLFRGEVVGVVLQVLNGAGYVDEIGRAHV